MNAQRIVTPIIAVWVAMLLLCTAAFAAGPFIRATVNTQGSIRVGQQVEIVVDVYVPNFFMSSPQFPVFDLPNAVVNLSDAADNLNDTVEGESFAGIRRTYLVTPQAGGNYTLPPAEVTFSYAAVPGQASPGKLALPPTSFAVEGAAPGATPSTAPTASRVTVTQTLDPDVKQMATGGTLMRTVEFAADGMQAMMIPEPQYSAPDGVRIYRHDPKLVDEKSPRGDFIGGRRTDTVTYLFEKAGSYTLPSIELTWTDPASGNAETTSAPAINIVVNPAAADTAIAPPHAEQQPVAATSRIDWKNWVSIALACVIALMALLWLVLSGLPRALAATRARREERERSEPAYFQRFQDACLRGNDAAVYARLDEWARQARLGPITVWLTLHGNDTVSAAYEALTASVYGSPQAGNRVDRSKLAAGFAAARGNWLGRQGAIRAAPALPPLNPAWSP